MAKTIPQLTDATTVNAADELIIQQGGITKRATAAELAKGLNTINESISVKDYGAVGDGATNDIAAFVAAADTGKHVCVPSGTYTITIANQTQATSIMSMMSRLHLFCTTLTINFAAGQFTMASATHFNVTNPQRLRFIGATPVQTTITSISSVTGSSGNYSVTANVANATGISIGDMVLVKNVEPSAKLPDASNPSRPVKGALQLGFFAADSAEMSLNGTSGTINKSTLTSVAANSDLLIADGRVKALSSVTSNSFSVDASHAPPKAWSDKQYWYTMRDSNRGTVTVSGTTVTGTSTQFTTDANVGDLIAIDGGGIRQITAIASNTSLTIAHAHPTISGATVYGIISAGETHDGAWVVTNVAGNVVTWTNTFQRSYAPPVNLVVGGDVTALKTNFIYTTSSGFVVDGGPYDLEQIGIMGGNGSSNVGVDLRGLLGEGAGHVIASNNVGVNGFDYGAWLSSGAVLQANNSFWSGQFFRGLNIAGGEARIEGAVISGCIGNGVLVSEGAFARMSATRIHGCSVHGLRLEVGGTTWADFAVIGHNGSNNVLAVGAVDVHFVGLRCTASGGEGIYGQNGGYGRASGALVLCCGNSGIALFHSVFEANQFISIGNGQNGALLSRGNYSFEESAFGYNETAGLSALRIARVSAATNTQFVGNGGSGVSVASQAIVYAQNAGLSLNSTNSAAAVTGGKLFIAGYGGTNSFSPALNAASQTDALVSDETVSAARPIKANKAHNFGTIAANTTVSTTITATGASATDSVTVSYNGADVTGLVVSARVSASDTVTVYAANVTTGSITVSNRTYYVAVLT
jgi:hypothetical protein